MTDPIPAEALDDRLGIVGATGSGKTYTAMTMIERLLGTGARCVIVDPLDVWWGLRLMADGVTPSPFSLPIFGGEHGDLPLTEHSGALIGETVAGMAESCIVSLGGFKSGASERRFMRAFLEALYRNPPGSLFHLVLDEADLWAPQQVFDKDGDAMALKGMVSTVVRRGRVKGFVPWLITQRPAVIDKSILSMVDGLIAMMLISPQDREALGSWIKGQASKEDLDLLLDALPSLAVGEGMVWLPRRRILERAVFPPKPTFDSSRAPKRGEAVVRRDLAPLDLDALKEQLVAVETEIKASDPKALRGEVVRLQRELAQAKTMTVVDEGAIAHARAEAFDQGRTEGVREGQYAAHQHAYSFALAELRPTIARLEELAYGEPSQPLPQRATPAAAPAQPRAEPVGDAQAYRPPPAPRPAPAPRADGALRQGSQKILAALEAVWPVALPYLTAAKHAGVGLKSSTFKDYEPELRASGLVEVLDDGRWRAMKQVGSPADLLSAYRAQWSPGWVKVWEVLAAAGAPVSREHLADAAGLSPTSSTTGAALSAFMKEELATKEGDGYVVAEAFR